MVKSEFNSEFLSMFLPSAIESIQVVTIALWKINISAVVYDCKGEGFLLVFKRMVGCLVSFYSSAKPE